MISIFTIINITYGEDTKPKSECICPLDYSPVCSNLITYSNKCIAKCSGNTKWYDGECRKTKRVRPQITPTFKKSK